ncbi:MAG: NlpC/P60 family protein [Deltaproteobacteria bacterium]|nr:NlpC/P60 family protein [Deltaproteobacteria bacterium]
MGKGFYVDIPVTDLTKEPKELNKGDFFDQNRQTQLLYNEEVNILHDTGNWCLVEALEQLSFRQKGYWAPYVGWVRKDHLRWSEGRLCFDGIVSSPQLRIGETFFLLGTKVVKKSILDKKRKVNGIEGVISPLSKKTVSLVKREDIVNTAKLFIGCPYLWGGRSIKYIETEKMGILTGVDCSGFVNLVFRVNGLDIPRDAHEQFMVSKKIKGEELKGGDLIFVSNKNNPGLINHVMIYCGYGKYIEASSKEGKVREGLLKERYDSEIFLPIKRVDTGDSLLFFGRILKEENG